MCPTGAFFVVGLRSNLELEPLDGGIGGWADLCHVDEVDPGQPGQCSSHAGRWLLKQEFQVKVIFNFLVNKNKIGAFTLSNRISNIKF